MFFFSLQLYENDEVLPKAKAMGFLPRERNYGSGDQISVVGPGEFFLIFK